MAREVWYQLVDAATRRPYADSQTTSVLSESANDIEDVRNKIHAEYDRRQPPGRSVLAHLSRNQLKLYATRAVYDDKDGQPLDEDSPVGALGASKNNALIVELPQQEPTCLVPDNKRQRTKAVNTRQLNEWVAIAQRLGDAEVGTVLNTPKAIFGTSTPYSLYIRQEYWDLHDIIQERVRSF